jgi:4-amino-4-deoxy-L-arabinose transferase-like glycosyltransferase
VYPPAPVTDRERYPVPFGGPPGPLRLFGKGLGDQGGWYLPFAVVGLLALLILILVEGRSMTGPPEETGTSPTENSAPERDHDEPAHSPDEPAPMQAGTAVLAPVEPPPAATAVPASASAARPGPPLGLRGRRDPRVAYGIVLGGWMLTEAVILSASKGIVHPYYISAIAPGTAAMAGIGVVAIARLCTGRIAIVGLLLAALAVLGTLAAELAQMHREHYLVSFEPVLLAFGAVLLGVLVVLVLLRRARLRAPGTLAALAALLLVLLFVPARYAATTWLAPVESTFPAAGPTQAAGHGGIGLNAEDEAITKAVLRYVHSHDPTPRFELLTVASDTSAPFILLGMKAGALGGYSGVDPVLDGAGLARLVARREARYVMLGGEYSTRGGNGATHAVLAHCRELDPAEWSSPVHYPYGLVLFDCRGHERELAAD